MKLTIYVESTVPAFYHEARTEPEMIARRDWTRQWWDERSADYQLLTSVAALDELGRGDYEGKSEVLEMLERVPLLPIETPIAEILRAYVLHKVMPKDPLGDGLHLALASFHKLHSFPTRRSSDLDRKSVV